MIAAAVGLALTQWACSDDCGSQPDSCAADAGLDSPDEPDISVELTPDATWDPDTLEEPDFARAPGPDADSVYSFANGCFAVEGFDGFDEPSFLTDADSGESFAFAAADLADRARFHMRATDLGSYLLYDSERRYFVAEAVEDGDEEWRFERPATLESDILLLDDSFRSPAEWVVEVSVHDETRFQLKHYQSGRYLSLEGLTEVEEEAAVVAFFATDDCAEFPEMSIDAVGVPEPRRWEDGDVFGVVDLHIHLNTNFGFGGGGVFHGHAFHRLGVEHALSSCEPFHGEDGKKDLIGIFYSGAFGLDIDSLLPLADGESDEFQHHTEGYPDFTDWPNAWGHKTHTATYYRWIERAYLGGLRLVVELATGNSVMCELVAGLGAQETRYSCNDMVSVARTLEELRNLERYVDAQAGGPGLGWFRIVTTPAEARAVINEGKLAVVLGIEISNLFDCFLTPPEGFEACDAETVQARLDEYYDLGVRVIFPVHKFDSAFGAGDGQDGVIEVANFINSGHYTNKTGDCPFESYAFDSGDVTFGDLNRPREVFDTPAPVDMSGFADNPMLTLLPYADALQSPPLRGNYCQKAGLTELGELLINEMMARGMIVDLAHIPQRGVIRALEILEGNDYPATATHGQTYGGRILDIGGMTGRGFGGCANPNQPDTMGNGIRAYVQERIDAGLYPAVGLSSDLNGLAGSRRPRFGEDSHCPQPQPDPITYPFTSFDGEVEFQQPHLGNRVVDFNTEGMLHIGLLPEVIEDARRDGMSDADLELLFRSAEAYLRMWEHAESRATELD